jgi:hypothetical protein
LVAFAALVATGFVASCGARTPLIADDGFHLTCVAGDIPLVPAQPEVMFVLDRSGSMSMDFSGGQSRWQALTESLAQTLPEVDATMALGALVFPSGSSNSNCAVPGQASLAPALHNVTPLVALMQAGRPGGATPTADAVDVAASLLLGVRAATTARALVLATDGEPNCNPTLNPNTCACVTSGTPGCRGNADQCLDDARTVQRIAAIYARGVPTYVIGITSGADADTFSQVLNDMAQAGGRPLTSAATKYYAARSPADLEAALTEIRRQVGGCTYLTSSVPDAAGSIAITQDGQTVAPAGDGGGSGWSWSSESNGQIMLLGSACDGAGGNPPGSLVAHVTCGGSADAGDGG